MSTEISRTFPAPIFTGTVNFKPLHSTGTAITTSDPFSSGCFNPIYKCSKVYIFKNIFVEKFDDFNHHRHEVKYFLTGFGSDPKGVSAYDLFF